MLDSDPSFNLIKPGQVLALYTLCNSHFECRFFFLRVVDLDPTPPQSV